MIAHDTWNKRPHGPNDQKFIDEELQRVKVKNVYMYACRIVVKSAALHSGGPTPAPCIHSYTREKSRTNAIYVAPPLDVLEICGSTRELYTGFKQTLPMVTEK
ncbi:hypothetical protein evm_007904 [Chilo suppressalis]|nr:hypothetical protein evm_007904 [Chilo suppressalis]